MRALEFYPHYFRLRKRARSWWEILSQPFYHGKLIYDLEKRVGLPRNTVSAILMSLLVLGTLALVFNIQPVKASGTTYIRTDSSIDPPTAPISTTDNIAYTLTANITSDADADGIVIERDNIVVDGANHTLQGIGGLARARGE